MPPNLMEGRDRPPTGHPDLNGQPWALHLWRRVRSWRRIHFTRPGVLYTGGTLLVGLAAFNTGNNLLYLLWGAMLGSIVVSSWLSEQTIRNLEIARRTPRGSFAGHPLRVRYQVRNKKERLPSYTLEIREARFSSSAFLPLLPAGETVQTWWETTSLPRGVYPLCQVTLSTSFPFGLFVKARDIQLPGELVVWPRNDRPAPRPGLPGGWRRTRAGTLPRDGIPAGEYRGLRPYRAGDDPRDIHWRTTARIGEPVVREYERSEGADSAWICLDRQGTPGGPAEEALEMAASLATSYAREARPFGFHTQGTTIEPGAGSSHLERTLDVLAALTFDTDAPNPVPPGPQNLCILIAPEPRLIPGFGAVLSPRTPGRSPSSRESGDAGAMTPDR